MFSCVFFLCFFLSFFYLVHFILLLLWDKPNNLHWTKNCFFKNGFGWFLYKYINICMYVFYFSNSHSLSHFFVFFFFFFFLIFNVLFKLKNEIFKGAKTEWSYTWMHQVLMNKIRTLGGTNHHVSLRVSNTPSPYNTLFVSLSALTLVCLSHHPVCWAVSFLWTAVEQRSRSQFFLVSGAF